MLNARLHTRVTYPDRFVIEDMSDCYTWSFPEFVPFCKHLYYFSTFKAFNASSIA